MLRLTLAQMRRSLGRLAAAGIAIAIGTAFLAATLLAGNAITRTTYDAVTSDLGDADLVVVPTEGRIDDTALNVVRAGDGVAVVDPYQEIWVDLSGPSGQTFVGARAPADDPRLETAVLESGELPYQRGAALPATLAEAVGANVGDTVQITRTLWIVPDDGTEPGPETETTEMPVVGITDDGQAALLGTPMIHVPADLLADWVAADSPEVSYPYLLVLADPGVRVDVLQQDLRTALAETGGENRVAVRTADEQAALITAQLTGSTTALTGLVLGFAAVALLVAALVITNTFQVIVAQRTRTLALLRCVGAVRGQLRRSVLTEAFLLGAASSVVGVLAGTGLVQLALTVLNARGTDVPLPASVTVSTVSVLVPLLCGTIVTVLASWSPARAATRVSPLSALTPSGPPPIGQRSGRLRAAFSVLLVLVGAGFLGLGTVAAREVDAMVGVGIGVLGGAVSFIGILLGAVYWVPRLVSGVGRLLARTGSPTATLATANSVRNPRRTAATSAALFIGVTLVAMMATGAAGARVALDAGLEEQFPVDVEVSTMDNGLEAQAVPPAVVDDVRDVDGVAEVVELTTATVQVSNGDSVTSTRVHAVDPDLASSVLLAPEHMADLADGVVVVPRNEARSSGIETGDEVTLDTGATTTTVQAVVSEMPGWDLVVTPDTMAAIEPDAPVGQLWVRLTGVDVVTGAVTEITSIASGSGESLSVVGSAVDRAFYDRVVNTLLAVVVGLLAVAVVIAVVGVANTLSLSVIERRRESAMLRAIGLSRRRLRGMLAIEGVLIAGVGALVGVLLGLVYGWVGLQTMLGELTPVGLTVPWGQLAMVLGVALLAGLLASVLPGRSAARTSPVEALAE